LRNFIKNLQISSNAKVQVLTDTEPNTASTITTYINAILQNYQQDYNKMQDTYQIQTQTRLYGNLN
jgi:ABC-2 type transport system permease protein